MSIYNWYSVDDTSVPNRHGDNPEEVHRGHFLDTVPGQPDLILSAGEAAKPPVFGTASSRGASLFQKNSSGVLSLIDYWRVPFLDTVISAASVKDGLVGYAAFGRAAVAEVDGHNFTQLYDVNQNASLGSYLDTWSTATSQRSTGFPIFALFEDGSSVTIMNHHGRVQISTSPVVYHYYPQRLVSIHRDAFGTIIGFDNLDFNEVLSAAGLITGPDPYISNGSELFSSVTQLSDETYHGNKVLFSWGTAAKWPAPYSSASSAALVSISFEPGVGLSIEAIHYAENMALTGSTLSIGSSSIPPGSLQDGNWRGAHSFLGTNNMRLIINSEVIYDINVLGLSVDGTLEPVGEDDVKLIRRAEDNGIFLVRKIVEEVEAWKMLVASVGGDSYEEVEANTLAFLGASDWSETPYANLEAVVEAVFGPPPYTAISSYKVSPTIGGPPSAGLGPETIVAQDNTWVTINQALSESLVAVSPTKGWGMSSLWQEPDNLFGGNVGRFIYEYELEPLNVSTPCGQHVIATTSQWQAGVQGSADLEAWETLPSGLDVPRDTAYSPELGVMVVVGHNYENTDIIGVSEDGGETFTTLTPPGGLQLLSHVAWSGDRFVALGLKSPNNTGMGAVWSADGYNWNFVSVTTTGYADLWAFIWAPSMSKFLAAFGQNVWYSEDGTSWGVQSLGANVWGLGANDTEAIAVAGSTVRKATTSPTSWTTTVASGFYGAYHEIAWSPELGLWVGASWDRMLTSPDAITWTHRTPATMDGMEFVVWSAALGMFITSGYRGVVWTSPDGASWTKSDVSIGMGEPSVGINLYSLSVGPNPCDDDCDCGLWIGTMVLAPPCCG